MDFETKKLVFIFVVVFISQCIQTITGFAGTMLSLPFLTFAVDLNTSKLLLVLIGIFWSIWILFDEYKFVDFIFIKNTIFFMIIGIILGMVLIKFISIFLIMLVMGCVIICSAVNNIRKILFNRKEIVYKSKYFDYILGIGAGIMQGMVLMGGPLLVIKSNSYFNDKKEYRSTLSVIWLILNFILLASYISDGVLTLSVIKLFLLCVVPLIISIIIGNLLYSRLNNKGFDELVNILLVISGLIVLIQDFT